MGYHTSNYTGDEIRTILSIRANEEEVELTGDALALLTKIGQETSLRYASNLISVAQQISLKKRASQVELQDIKRAYMLFLDSDRSVQYLEKHSSQYIDDFGNVVIGKGDNEHESEEKVDKKDDGSENEKSMYSLYTPFCIYTRKQSFSFLTTSFRIQNQCNNHSI